MKRYIMIVSCLCGVICVRCIIGPPEKTPSIGLDRTTFNFGEITKEEKRDLHIWNDGAGGKLQYTIEISKGSTYFDVIPREGMSSGEDDDVFHAIYALYSRIPEGQTKYGEIKIVCSNANDSPRYISLSASRGYLKSYEDMIEESWIEYINGNSLAAKTNFENAISSNQSEAEAYIGKGWCELKLSQIDNSILSFNTAVSKKGSDNKDDIYAGLCFAYDLKDLHDECISASTYISSSWEFEHNSSLDYNDIILLRAVSYYAKGDFANCLREIRRLDNQFSVDVETIKGRADLADKIEELDNIY